MVRQLLSQGAEVNARNNEGSTPLHLAAYHNNEELVKLLIENGADVNARDSRGRTALHIAAENHNKELILLLLSKGAYPFEMDNLGIMPLEAPLAEDAPREDRLFHIKEGYAVPVTSLCFSPGGRFMASGGEDGSLRLWSPASGKLIADLTGHRGSITSISFSRGGSIIASGSLDGTVILRDWSDRNISEKLLHHGSPVTSLSLSSEGRYVISGCADGSLKLWDAISGKLIKSVILHKMAVNALCISPDNRHIVTGSKDGTLMSIDFPGLRSPAVLYTHSSEIRSICFSPGGRVLASGDASGEIITGDPFSRKILRRYKGHKEAVESILYSPSGRYIISAGRDGIIKSWDTLHGNRPMTIYRGIAGISCVKFSPGGRYLLAGSEDGSITVIDSVFGTLLATLVGMRNGEWISMTPDLFFDSSLNGAHYILLQSKGTAATLEQYRKPRKSSKAVRDIISGKMLPVKAHRLPEPPEIRIISPSGGESKGEKITIKAEVKGKCRVKDLLVLINGRPARTEGINENDIPDTRETREISTEIRLQPGLNTIEAIAISTDEVKSIPDTVAIYYLFPHVVPSKRLFLLAVGINDYEKKGLSLDCAAPDAREVEAFFKRMKGLLFEEVKTVSLIDSAAEDHAILDALEKIGRESAGMNPAANFQSLEGSSRRHSSPVSGEKLPPTARKERSPFLRLNVMFPSLCPG